MALAAISQSVFRRRGFLNGFSSLLPGYKRKTIKSFFVELVRYWRRNRLRQEMENGLEDVLIDIAEGLKAGENIHQAVKRTCSGSRGLWREMLSNVLMRHENGLSLGEAFNLLEKVQSQKVMLMVRAIQINQWAGGDLSQILFKLAKTLREERGFEEEMRIKTAESRWTAYLLAGTPLLMGVFLARLQPDTLKYLFYDQTGRFALLYACFSWLTGLFLFRKIVKF